MYEDFRGFAGRGFLNLAGGCCGTTPAHIQAIADAVRDIPPRIPPAPRPACRLSGLEPFNITADSLFVNVGERCNVTGSAKFKRLVLDGNYEAALEVARVQVADGAQIIDINMDEGMLDAKTAMVTFLNLIAAEPDISRVPIMVDSSKWEIIEAGLKCIQGKAVVNSISLKSGEEEFLTQARLCQRYGAAVVVMAFDEHGQADNLQRRKEICKRCYDLLVDELDFNPNDIIFDPNIFAIATGIDEHNNYAVEFIEATRYIKAELPGALVSGGVSNVSFSFRGNDAVREAIHSVFLYHAIRAGMDMGIVNAGQLAVYDSLPADLREGVEDVILNRRDDGTERLLTLAERYRSSGAGEARVEDLSWREQDVAKRLEYALVKGINTFVLEITDGRRFLIGTFAAGIILLPLGRRLMRVWVFDRRRDGHLMRRTLLIGEGRSLKELKVRLSFDPRTGFEVVESMPGPSAGPRGIDGWLDQVEQAIVDQDVDAVAISQTSSISSEVIRRLSWRLEGPNVALLVAPALGDATGPRLNIRPAAGLPLLHLDEPRLTGPQALLKRATDIFVSGLGLLLISPLLLLIALAIRITSPGHALFIQDRVGQAGEVYRLVKFRSMYDGSEEIRTDTLGSLAGDPESYRTDPRVTPLGRFLRRWSLDELPQLWNVLMGEMSLVGPRPMLVEELPLLGTTDHRRHLTKPGMTGLWQVAGRKEVAWNERMQMDLRYVENWSPALDLVILAKTVKAVATGRGAH